MAFCTYNEYQRRQIADELGNESLFICLHEHLNREVMFDPETTDYDYSFVEVWEDAKFFIKTIAKEKHPRIHAKEHINELILQYASFSGAPRGRYDEPTVWDNYELDVIEQRSIVECTLMCAYYMLYVTRYFYDGPINVILNKIMTWIEVNISNKPLRYSIEDDLRLEKINASLVYDYDYWKGEPHTKENNTFNSSISDPEFILGLRNKIAELEKNLADANAKIKEAKNVIDEKNEVIGQYNRDIRDMQAKVNRADNERAEMEKKLMDSENVSTLNDLKHENEWLKSRLQKYEGNSSFYDVVTYENVVTEIAKTDSEDDRNKYITFFRILLPKMDTSEFKRDINRKRKEIEKEEEEEKHGNVQTVINIQTLNNSGTITTVSNGSMDRLPPTSQKVKEAIETLDKEGLLTNDKVWWAIYRVLTLAEFGYPTSKPEFCKAIENLALDVSHNCEYNNWRNVTIHKLAPSPDLWENIENLGEAESRQRKVGIRLLELLRQ